MYFASLILLPSWINSIIGEDNNYNDNDYNDDENEAEDKNARMMMSRHTNARMMMIELKSKFDVVV